MHRHMRGFTLIELMLVTAIIALLASIALPAYNAYRARAAEGACHAEMKSYATLSIALLQDNTPPKQAPRSACSAADDATAIGVAITGTPKPPGARITTCNMYNGNCSLP